MRIEVHIEVDILDFGRFMTQNATIGILICLIVGVIAVKTVLVEGLTMGVVDVD